MFDWYETQRVGLGEECLLSIEATLSEIRRRPESFQLVLERLRATQRAMEMSVEEIRSELLDNQKGMVKQRPGFVARNAPPRWGTFALKDPPDDSTGTGADWAFGWPAKSMWCRIRSKQSWSRVWGGEIDGGLHLSGAPSAVMRDFRVLPLWPIWPGVILNTLLFALLWIALLVGPWMTRRWLRARRGCCASCGYDLRGITSERCPECGITRARLRLRAG